MVNDGDERSSRIWKQLVYFTLGNTPAYLERNDVYASGFFNNHHKSKNVQIECRGSKHELKYVLINSQLVCINYFEIYCEIA